LLFTEYKGRGYLSIGRFYIRRLWKLYPPFIVFIAATAVYQLVEHGTIDKWALLSEVTFLQNYLPGLWGHTWSLAVEEHFYLLLPCVLLVILHFSRSAHRPLEPVLLAALGVAASSSF
jgi:peptidoglycan/LPS O-acetylase OafA/YrhL